MAHRAGLDFQPLHAVHVHVDEHDIRFERRRLLHRFLPAGRVTGTFDIAHLA